MTRLLIGLTGGLYRFDLDAGGSQKKGTIKDVQGVMRHSRTATTTDVYMQEIPASVQSTINSINLELRKSDERNWRKPQNTMRAGAARDQSAQALFARDTK